MQKSKRKFKPGDKVFELEDYTWGTAPMEVIGYYNEFNDSIKCEHPTLGSGYFNDRTLIKVNPARQQRINMYLMAEKYLREFREELFGKE